MPRNRVASTLRAPAIDGPKPGVSVPTGGQSAAKPPAAPASTALTNAIPFGVPSPVASSQPGAAASELSVPKVMTYQRVDVPL